MINTNMIWEKWNPISGFARVVVGQRKQIIKSKPNMVLVGLNTGDKIVEVQRKSVGVEILIKEFNGTYFVPLNSTGMDGDFNVELPSNLIEPVDLALSLAGISHEELCLAQ